MSFLKCCIAILAFTNAAMAGFASCPSDDFLEERVAATEMVTQSVSAIFSSDSNSTNGTQLDIMGLYIQTSASYNATVTTNGFVEFQEAINEISTALFDACSAPEDSRPEADDVPVLIEMFEGATAAGNISQARQLLGTLLCLQDLLERNVTRRKRQSSPIDVLNAFFDSLDGDMAAAPIFGVNIFAAAPPTLAFVVDDTGSMAAEIASVQRLIRSFIRTERTAPLAYILTTFNDPSKHYMMFVISR